MVLGWSILGHAWLFRFILSPCLAETALAPHYLGGYSTLGDQPGRGEEVPPHLRAQRTPPFVCPLTDLNHDELGIEYSVGHSISFSWDPFTSF